MPQSSKPQPAPRDWQRFARLGFSAFILLCILGGLVFGVVAGCTLDVGKLEQQKLSTVVYGANDKVVTVLFQENRDYITLDKVPQSIKDAFIATEDTKFYEHRGIDVMGIGRALLADLRLGSLSQGASTITQQLVRQTYLSNEKSVARKVREAIYAVVIERYYTKDQIFEKYLNKVYFGRSAYGVQAAALSYFGKNAADLNLSESALIAGLVQAPSTYMNNPAKAQARRNDVLDRMVAVGFITPNEGALARRQPVQFVERTTSRNIAPYFLDYIVQELVRHGIDQTEIYTGGLQIKTTLDVDAQKAAETAFANGLPAASPDGSGVAQPQAALVAIDPHTGYIKAMIGGRDFGNTQLNRAVMAYRQPGSTMKPFVYTAAIDNQFTPSSVLTDEPISYRTGGGRAWAPQNYDHKFRGPITLREALENSVNVIAVKLVDELGVQTVMKYAQRMGLNSMVTTGPRNDMNLSSLALGGLTRGVTPLELATAYTPLANRGVRVEPIAVLEVRDRTGAVLYRNHTRQTAVLSASTAYMVTDMMRGVIERGTGTGANIGRPAAGKTGTTSDNTNAWFIGYTPDLLSVVWLGNDSQRKPLIVNGSLIGSGTAARIWGRFMSAALAKTPASDFRTSSANLVTVDICADSGYLATPDCPNIRSETFVSGTQPTESCPLHSAEGQERYQAVQVCLLSGKLATKNCPENQVVTRYYDRTTAKELRGDSTLPQEYCDLHSQQEVTVKICTESGLLATPYCPADSVIMQTFIDGEQPTQPCNIHHP